MTNNLSGSENKIPVFIVGSKGIPAKYGGFETFVDNLVSRKVNKNIEYYVACLSDKDEWFLYNGAHCLNTKVPNIGPAKAVYYDMKALSAFILYCKKHPEIKNPIFYILTCRIGPFMRYYDRKIKKLGGTIFVNPDGHEWARKKWNYAIRKYWKSSEKHTIKHADKVICDSENIQSYVLQEYAEYNPDTTFIAYGSELEMSNESVETEKYNAWLEKFNLKKDNYYLTVGRFVPENNFKTMIGEYMKTKTEKPLVIITTEDDKFFKELKEKLHFENDSRIIFPGTVYDTELLKQIRTGAYAYIHGHEVGGTNPSLLEALSFTKLNLLLNVPFNMEVGKDAGIYWSKNEGSLCGQIENTDKFGEEEIEYYSQKSKQRIKDDYSWERIVDLYEKYFENGWNN